MEIEGVLAIVFLFGGGTLVGLSMSPIGRAIAARIQKGAPGAARPEEIQGVLDSNHAVLEEVEGLRRDIAELQERVDFHERMLSRQREERLPGPPG